MGDLISIRSAKEEVAYCPECGCQEFYVHTHTEDGSLELDFLECVDCAVPQNDYSPLNNVKALGADILIESSSHLGNKYLEDLKKEFKGRVIMTPYYPEQSSTTIKNKIKEE